MFALGMDYVLLELVGLEDFETRVAHVVHTVGLQHVEFSLVLSRSLGRRLFGSQGFPGSRHG